MENGQLSLYCCFNKIIKRSGTSFQSPALSQEHVRNVCHTAHSYSTKFHFGTYDSKKINISLTSIIYSIESSKSVHFTRTQKSRYLENET